LDIRIFEYSTTALAATALALNVRPHVIYSFQSIADIISEIDDIVALHTMMPVAAGNGEV